MSTRRRTTSQTCSMDDDDDSVQAVAERTLADLQGDPPALRRYLQEATYRACGPGLAGPGADAASDVLLRTLLAAEELLVPDEATFARLLNAAVRERKLLVVRSLARHGSRRGFAPTPSAASGLSLRTDSELLAALRDWFPDVVPRASALVHPHAAHTWFLVQKAAAERPVIALLAMLCIDPGHSDAVRAEALRRLYPRARVFGVAGGTRPGSDAQLFGDLRRLTCFVRKAGARGDTDCIAQRDATVLLLDYFWMPQTYLRPESNCSTHGYGTGWFTVQLPAFFAHGGRVAVLPNDRWGLLRGMAEEARWTELTPLDRSEADRHHPLWRATAAATATEAWSLRRDRQRTNELAAAEYLDPDHPFLLVWPRGGRFDDAVRHLHSGK